MSTTIEDDLSELLKRESAVDQARAELQARQKLVDDQRRTVHDKLLTLTGDGGVYLSRRGSPTAYIPSGGKLQASKVIYGDAVAPVLPPLPPQPPPAPAPPQAAPSIIIPPGATP
jgi:hypothetical protein